ncbi:MAG: FtsQ-type POTRA domain-containing protein [Actinobacteria bacterium]|nr:FtsQ-type POTRA domain-containing protein [Actinomycetota bacterium]
MKRRRKLISSQIPRKGAASKAQPKAKGESSRVGRLVPPNRGRGNSRSTLSARKRIVREQRQHARARRQILVVCAVAAALAIVAFSVIAIVRSDIFKIQSVDVVGNNRLTDQEVIDLAKLPENETLLRVAVTDIERRVERDPWVASADVSRRIPTTLRINITERVPAAILDVGQELYAIDRLGNVLEQQLTTAAPAALVIRDIQDIEPVVGGRPDSDALENALRVYGALNQEMLAITRAISAPTVEETAIITEDGVEIFVGAAENMLEKQQIAFAILQERAGKVVYINVRSIERPTWRALE